MKPFATRCLSIAALSVLLAACQTAQQGAEPPTDALSSGFLQLDQSLAAGQLAEAESQLRALEGSNAADARVAHYQRQLADAWLKRSQVALQLGDLDGAATALSHARSLMPKAPALTEGLNGAIDKARQAGNEALPLEPAPQS
ncbi:hypothetical protein [Pseudomonas sp. Q1-7]|uniref:hypothetical protein n=1 Tax=Pseudomonas sp. Q1-7 TaxID=3020843 RepID=UPI0022FFCFF8|nr:hypothetical protein [Pseudomonas sp. Q1-7]